MLSIREGTTQDAPAIASLSATLGYPADPAVMQVRLQRIIPREDQRVFIAEDDQDRVCGWLTAHSFNTLASGFRVQITGLVVADTHRRQGVGRLLVAEAEAWAKEIGAEAVVVFSNVKRIESHAFYPALGYTNTKTEAVYRKILDPSLSV
jgi:GNAT superfamily N-acetyltransferase|uniref:GNAT family N-acetyltransferase n=1 Tax=Cephaloticoccus sp. TaxID=1985742 RepID=UPI0040491996